MTYNERMPEAIVVPDDSVAMGGEWARELERSRDDIAARLAWVMTLTETDMWRMGASMMVDDDALDALLTEVLERDVLRGTTTDVHETLLGVYESVCLWQRCVAPHERTGSTELDPTGVLYAVHEGGRIAQYSPSETRSVIAMYKTALPGVMAELSEYCNRRGYTSLETLLRCDVIALMGCLAERPPGVAEVFSTIMTQEFTTDFGSGDAVA